MAMTGRRDARGIARAERDYAARNELQSCAMCGRQFIKRKGWFCSMACLEKSQSTNKEKVK
jgi:hypothetical protein